VIAAGAQLAQCRRDRFLVPARPARESEAPRPPVELAACLQHAVQAFQARVAKLLASGEPLKAGAQAIQCTLNLLIGPCCTVTRKPESRRPHVELSTSVQPRIQASEAGLDELAIGWEALAACAQLTQRALDAIVSPQHARGVGRESGGWRAPL